MIAELNTIIGEDLDDFAEASGITVAWPGIEFDPSQIPEGVDAYLKASIAEVGNADIHGVCGEATRLFLVQIAVGIRDGSGEMPALRIAEELRKHFPFNRNFQGFRYRYGIRSPLSTAPSLTERGWVAIPTSFQVYTIQ